MILYIIAIIYGLLIGNFATSAYFRIPKHIPLNGLNNKLGKKPHCSTCGHELKFWEYLPLLSWIFTRFKCNYCGAPTNPIYTFLEASITILSVILLYKTGMNLYYVGSVLVGAALILNLTLYYKYRKLFVKGIGVFAFTILLSLLIINF